MKNKKTIMILLTIIVALSFNLLTVSADEINRGTCEMTIKSLQHPSSSSPANATGDCYGLVFGFYHAPQNAFRIFGMSNYDVEYSGQQFIVATPAGKYTEAILTVYTIQEDPPEEPKPPKEEPSTNDKPKDPPTDEKDTNSTPKEEPSKNDKSSGVQKPTDKSSTNDDKTSSPPKNNPSSSEDKPSSTDQNLEESAGSHEQETKNEDPEKEKISNEEEKISDILVNKGISLEKFNHEKPELALMDSYVKKDNTERKVSHSTLIYVLIGVTAVSLLIIGCFVYRKRKVS
jgi:hypothetical protein